MEKPTVGASLKALRQDLNQLRRQARELDQKALEDCLTLAISPSTTAAQTTSNSRRYIGDRR